MFKLFGLAVREDAVVLAVNYYPPKTGAEIKEAQACKPEEALSMRQQFAASVDEAYITDYINRVAAAAERLNLPAFKLSTGQMVIIGEAGNIATARAELDGRYHMSEFSVPEFAQRMKLIACNAAAQQPRILTVSVYNAADQQMFDALNANGGITLEDEHSLYQRAVARFGGEGGVQEKLVGIADAHNLRILPYEARDEFVFKGRATDIEQAAAAAEESGFQAADLDPQQFMRHLEMMRSGTMRVASDDGFDDDDGPQGGSTAFH